MTLTFTRGRWATGMALIAMAALAACGGGKRPPALTGGPPPATARTPPPAAEPVEPGPDVGRLPNEGALGADLAAEANTEGGPLADIHFGLDSSALGDAARQTLGQHATWLKSHAAAQVTIEGHCDERGTVEYNLALGEQRAKATKEYLVSLGITAGRLRILSFGKEKPVDPGNNEAAWAKNRRAHFVVSGG